MRRSADESRLTCRGVIRDEVACVAAESPTILRIMLIALGDRAPVVPDSAWVAPGASLIGDVRLADGASVFYGAVLRADNEPITVGRGSNIQDNCVFHVDPGRPITLGEGVSVGHGAVVHGATIGNHVLVGMSATVMNGAVVGDEVLIAAGALVTEGMEVPPRTLVAGVPARVRRELSDDEVARLHVNAAVYEKHREIHREGRVIG
jgi:carbonic anhydrase/acetyltransferase-like protein (isoleucine patch superfamily)